MSDVFEAPCRWCGYNGPNYWQEGTHGEACPWATIGGREARQAKLAKDRGVIAHERANWHEVMHGIATEVAKRSRDTGTKVGAVVCTANWRVVGTGYNGPPAGSPHDLPMEGPGKHAWVIHAEVNALLQAIAALGTNDLKGCIVFCTHRPCVACVRFMFHLGVRIWHYQKDELDDAQHTAVEAAMRGLFGR